MMQASKHDSSEDIAFQLLSAAKKAGADDADVLVAEGVSTNVEVRNATLELAERSEGIDLGLRVFLGKKQAIVSGSDGRPETIAAMAERAIAMAKEAPDDPYCGLAQPEDFAKDWDIAAYDLYDSSEEPDADHLQREACKLEAAALDLKGIEQTSNASASYSKSAVFLATSNGFSGSYQRTSHGLSCVAIAGTGLGMERDYDYDDRIYGRDLRPAEEIGRRAAERALSRLNPEKPRSGVFPVLFDERVASSLIGHLINAVNGASVARGSSWLRNHLNQQVLPASLSLVEDPTRPRTSGSRPFDAEGLPKRPRHIVNDGLLQGWTLDLSSARKLGMTSTGNAARSAGSLPSPQVGNVTLGGGEKTRAELLSDMGTGLLVTSMIGSTINPNTGDYSRGAAGHWVENGEIVSAVSECTIAGNLKDMLLRMIAGNDAQVHLSRRVPSVLIEGMHIAGQ